MDLTFSFAVLLTVTVFYIVTCPCAGQEVNESTSSSHSHAPTSISTATSRILEVTTSQFVDLSKQSQGQLKQTSQGSAQDKISPQTTITTTAPPMTAASTTAPSALLLPPLPPTRRPLTSSHTHAAPPRVQLKTEALLMATSTVLEMKETALPSSLPPPGRDSTTAAGQEECADSPILISGMYTCQHYISIQDLLCTESYYKKMCCDSCKWHSTPAPKKIEEDTVAQCLDEQGLINDIATCSNIVSNTPNLCYFDVYKVKCCNSCSEGKAAEQKGCEYGDKIPGCKKDQCAAVSELCCDTCTSDNPRKINYCAYITKDNSPELCRNPSACQDELFRQHCCQSCGHNRFLASTNSSVSGTVCTSLLLIVMTGFYYL